MLVKMSRQIELRSVSLDLYECLDTEYTYYSSLITYINTCSTCKFENMTLYVQNFSGLCTLSAFKILAVCVRVPAVCVHMYVEDLACTYVEDLACTQFSCSTATVMFFRVQIS